MKLLFCLPMILLVACGPKARPKTTKSPQSVQGWPAGQVKVQHGKFTLWLPPGADASRLEKAVDVVTDGFQSFMNQPIPPCQVCVVSGRSIVISGGVTVSGRWLGPDGFPDSVMVVEGDDDLPTLFHELVHLTLQIVHAYPVDDPRWRGWDAEGKRISDFARANR